ncbi:perforin-like protein 3 [Plasmodium malariae]|uniref:Perforin-like protein 3 n=1 Tax=Plasmodium malariae TaxID=5858 RepID=A0A1C3KBR2_PLAMA|nr:perforin-like protein 3 [Plasmodium malariae]
MIFQRVSFLLVFCTVIVVVNIIHDSFLIYNAYMKDRLTQFRICASTVGEWKKINYAEKLHKQNREILIFLQHEREFHQINAKKSVRKSVKKNASGGAQKVKRQKRTKEKIAKKEDSTKWLPINRRTNQINRISFKEVGNNADNVNDKKEEELKYGECEGNARNCVNKKVQSFVKLMKGIDTVGRERDRANGIEDDVNGQGGHYRDGLNDPNEQNVYNDKHHTVVVYDGIDEKKDLYNKYKVERENGMQTKVIQGTEYLGVGYDFIFGNPIGDPFLKVDPGYRDTIIKLTYPKSDEDYPDSYTNINPNGSYVRNEISCNRSENESEISSMNEYTKELSVDASIGASYGLFGSFSASTGYKSTSNTISKKKFRMFILKSYCFKYVASLSQYAQWKLSDPFLRSINLLPSYFNSLEHDGAYCTVEDYREEKNKGISSNGSSANGSNGEGQEKCGRSVYAWLYFFKNFGTHVSTVIHLGGKITQQVKISKNEYKALSEKGLSVSVSASVGLGLFKAKASTNTDSNELSKEDSSNSSMEKETIIIGGTTIYDPNDPTNFEMWAKSIKDNPMPIKAQYEPLSRILPIRLTKVYDEALSFYISLNVPVNVGQVSNDEMKHYNIKDQLMKSKIVYGSGPGLVVLECEEKQNFILGFSLSIPNDLTNLKDFHMSTCDEDSDKCYSRMSDNSYNYLFAMCNDEMIPFFEQKVKSGTGLLTLECSEKNQVILFGFGISVLNSNDPMSIAIYPCKYGKSSCSMQGPTDQSAVGLWIVCGHEESSNSKFSVYVRKLAQDNVSGKKKKSIDICPEKVLFNLIFEFTKTPINKRNGLCFTVNDLCPKDFHVCSDKKNLKTFNYYSVSVY